MVFVLCRVILLFTSSPPGVLWFLHQQLHHCSRTKISLKEVNFCGSEKSSHPTSNCQDYMIFDLASTSKCSFFTAFTQEPHTTVGFRYHWLQLEVLLFFGPLWDSQLCYGCISDKNIISNFTYATPRKYKTFHLLPISYSLDTDKVLSFPF